MFKPLILLLLEKLKTLYFSYFLVFFTLFQLMTLEICDDVPRLSGGSVDLSRLSNRKKLIGKVEKLLLSSSPAARNPFMKKTNILIKSSPTSTCFVVFIVLTIVGDDNFFKASQRTIIMNVENFISGTCSYTFCKLVQELSINMYL